jgi:glutamate synthase domain-containing protein 3
LQVNTEIVAIQRVITSAGEAQLKGLIQQQAAKTGSKKATALLADWTNAKAKFWQIVPPGEFVFLLPSSGPASIARLKEAGFVACAPSALVHCAFSTACCHVFDGTSATRSVCELGTST